MIFQGSKVDFEADLHLITGIKTGGIYYQVMFLRHEKPFCHRFVVDNYSHATSVQHFVYYASWLSI